MKNILGLICIIALAGLASCGAKDANTTVDVVKETPTEVEVTAEVESTEETPTEEDAADVMSDNLPEEESTEEESTEETATETMEK